MVTQVLRPNRIYSFPVEIEEPHIQTYREECLGHIGRIDSYTPSFREDKLPYYEVSIKTSDPVFSTQLFSEEELELVFTT